MLFLLQINDSLDLDLKYFESIYAIDIPHEENDSGFFIFDPNEYFEEDNIPQNKKNIQMKQTEDVETNNNNNNSSKSAISNNNTINYNNEKINNQSLPRTINTNNTTNDFNFVAVGDWDCTSETKDTVDNILEHDPELVLALGDLSYNGKAKCWLKIIEPFANKTKIVIGNHEVESSKILRDYMNFFGLEKQYYSFNYENIHFLALSTEMPYEEDSQQYEFAIQDLEKYSNDPSIDWIVAFYHRQLYSSGGGPEDEEDFREVYHPIFDKYKVDLALQGHHHVYERIYPITFNDDEENEPFVRDENLRIYNNPEGTIFITAGTGGANDMQLSKSKSFSAIGIDSKFGILNIAIENNGTSLTGTFIENENDNDILDKFTIIKNKE
jgi:hypothetical protein